MKPYLTIEKEAMCETRVKKSRFICSLYPVDSHEEAAEKIAEAKRNTGTPRTTAVRWSLGRIRPSGVFQMTANPRVRPACPMLEALAQSGMTNLLAVVTRYFGGVLLGAGGLVRAYSSAVSCALKSTRKVRMVPSAVYGVTLPYASYGKLETISRAGGYLLENALFGEEVTADLLVPKSCEEKFLAEISEAFFGQIRPHFKGERYLTQSV